MTTLVSPTSSPLDNSNFTKLDSKEDNNGNCAVLEAESPEFVRSPVSPLFETFTECAKQVVTEVEGHIPEWISGTVVRVGPGKFEFGEDKMKHWFDGHAIVHKFTLNQGKVMFESRFVESETYKANTLHQRVTATEFGTASTPDPCMSMFARFKANFFKTNRTDNANVNVFKYGDALIVNTDSPIAQVVQTDLTTVGKTNMSESIAVNMVTSHPHFDAEGAMYVSASSFKGRPRYHIVRIPPPTQDQSDTLDLLSRAEIVAEIPARHALHPTYCHSFGMTDNYFVFCETPVTLNLIKTLTRVFTDGPINDVFNYDPEAMALFHIIDRRTGQRINTQFQIKGIFFYHMINCYEEDDHLVIDLCSFYDFKDSDLFTEPLEEFRNGLFIEEKKWAQYKHHPLRLVVPLMDHSLQETGANLVTLPNTDCKAYLTGQNVITLEGERLLPQGQDRIDMPQINYEKFNGKKYKYFYGTGLFVNQHFMNALGKVDVENKTCLRWLGTVDQYPSEPVFVPSPQAKSEDDGVVLSSVCDTDPEKRDFLVVLDASTFQELGRAYVPSDVTVPYSFHGSYYNH